MHFSFVPTVFFLLLATIVRDEGVSLADDICNVYIQSNIFIDNSTRISFSKTPALTLSCLGLCTQNTLFKKCGHNPSLKLSLLLLLSGDVSLNPGPNISCNMRFATTNLRSVRQKSAALSDLISSKQIDILAMTETWLSSCDTAACLADISPPGFSLFHCPRLSGRGGGVAFLVRETFKVEIIHTPKFLSFEAICILVKHSSITANFICIYRPPGCAKTFFDEFPNFPWKHFAISGWTLHFWRCQYSPWQTQCKYQVFLGHFGHFFFAPTCNISNKYLWTLVRLIHHTIELQTCKSYIFLRWFIWSPNGTYWFVAPN